MRHPRVQVRIIRECRHSIEMTPSVSRAAQEDAGLAIAAGARPGTGRAFTDRTHANRRHVCATRESRSETSSPSLACVSHLTVPRYCFTQLAATRPAMRPAPRVDCAAIGADEVHRASEELGEDGASEEDCEHQADAEQGRAHSRYFPRLALALWTASTNLRAVEVMTSSRPSRSAFASTSSPPTATAAAPALMYSGVA